MKLEKQVCSLELAKQLKELRVKQESLFYYVQDDSYYYYQDMSLVYGDGYGWHEYPAYSQFKNKVSAFTATELGEMLPGNMGGEMYFVHQWGLLHNRAYTTAKSVLDDSDVVQFEENTEADARAKMLIYLLENNLLEI